MGALIGLFLLLINVLSPAVAIVWLGIIGEWKVILVSFLIYISSPAILGFLLILSFPLVLPIPFLIKHKDKFIPKILFYSLSSISILWPYVLMYVWTVLIFNFMFSIGKFSIVPFMLLSYSLSVAPWYYMARQERDSPSAIMSCMFLSVASIIYMILNMFRLTSFENSLNFFFLALLIGYVINVFVAFKMIKEEDRTIGEIS
jgi:hypothetical protein